MEANETNNWRAFGVGQYRDADGDGMPNLLEYLADTNPTNALSVLRISRIVPEANGLRLEWQGGVAAKQFLERSRSVGTNHAQFYRVRAVRE